MNKRLVLAFALPIALLLLAAALYYEGVWSVNNPSRAEYPVRGVDVSAYQGEINWPVLAAQDIDFAFIKATEGSSFVDPRFQANWAGARDAGLVVGAYHFFSFESGGDTQAQNMMSTVPVAPDALPPVVDVELYGAFRHSPPDRSAVDRELSILLAALEAHYRVKPILYATGDSYRRYLSGAYADHPIWIRSVYGPPNLDDGREWTFWQYSARARLDGYRGEERFIDLNVFRGTAEELNQRKGGFIYETAS
jgi:lysozyme